MSLSRTLQYAFLAIIVTTVGFSLYQWNASRASTQKTAPNNGLVGYWSFNEGTGTLAGDASVNKNTGTLTNGPTWVSGKLGQAVSLDGVNDYIDMGNSSALKPSFPFSVSTWAMIPSGGSAVMITTADTVSPVGEYSGYSVAIATNQIVAMVGNNAGWCSGTYRNAYVTNSTTLNVNQWYHVTAVFTNASSFSVYVNGSSVALTQSGTNGISIGYAAGVPLRIGRRFNSCPDTTYYDKGIVDELRIYNRALSGTEITNLYNLGAERLNVSPVSNLTSGLVGYWTFDGKDTPWSSSSAGTATDRSGNSNTGTLTNMSQSTSPTIGKLGQALNF
ncbi:MAG: LamG domain-containing protein, partial [Candidatus Moraniibacteriota bacterium]